MPLPPPSLPAHSLALEAIRSAIPATVGLGLDRVRRKIVCVVDDPAITRVAVGFATGPTTAGEMQEWALPRAQAGMPRAALMIACPELLDLSAQLILRFSGPEKATEPDLEKNMELRAVLADLPEQGPASLRAQPAQLDALRGRLRVSGWYHAAGQGGTVGLFLAALPERSQQDQLLAQAQHGQNRAELARRNPFLAQDCGWKLETRLDQTVLAELRAGRAKLLLRVFDGGAEATASLDLPADLASLSPDQAAALALRQRAIARAASLPTARLNWLLASDAFRRRWQAKGDSPGWIIREVLADALAQRLHAGDEIAVRLDSGDLVLCQPIDDSILARRFLFEAGDEQGFLAWIAARISPGDVAIDLGAAYGVVSRAMARQGGLVVAVEADPFSAGRIRRSQLDFPNGGAIDLVEAAVSDSAQDVVFAGMGGSVVGSGKIIADDAPETVAAFLAEVSGLNQVPLSALDTRGRERRQFGAADVMIRHIPGTTVDAICAAKSLRDVAVMKIDIEGGELLALRGAVGLLDGAFGVPPVVAFEYSALFPTRGGLREEILAMFFSRAWRIYRLGGGKNAGGDLVEIRDAAEAPFHDNLIAVPPGRF